MRYTVRKSVVDVVGRIWMPGIVCAQRIELSAYDLDNARDDAGKLTRDSVLDWLGSHAGDFASIIDFQASLEDGDTTVDIPFATEEGETAWLDCQSGED